MKKAILLLVIIILSSCASSKRVNKNDYYKLINLTLGKAEKIGDSIHIFDWKPKNIPDDELKNYHQILLIKDYPDSFRYFVKFLNDNGIDHKREYSYFSKQIKNFYPISSKKIDNKKVRIITKDRILKNPFQYNNNDCSSLYFFNFSKPVFTMDGKKAIISYIDEKCMTHFEVYKKIHSEWKSSFEFFYSKQGIE